MPKVRIIWNDERRIAETIVDTEKVDYDADDNILIVSTKNKGTWFVTRESIKGWVLLT